MARYRAVGISVTPKAHILEDHVVPILERCRVGLAYLGESGGEKLHAKFNRASPVSQNMRGEEKKLEVALVHHLTEVLPTLYL